MKQVVSECDLHGDGLLEHDELIRCWQIVESEEYVIASLLQGNPGVPKVYGVCGELYAEEYVDPLQSSGARFLTRQMPWKSKARIALAILDLLEAIEDTPYGTLYYCDVKPLNMGILRQGGKTIAKVIDLDTSWFGDSMRVVEFQYGILGKQCKSDPECDYSKCHFACNTTSLTCTDEVISNNFQVRVYDRNRCTKLMCGQICDLC